MKPLVVADENIPGVSEQLVGIADVRLFPGREITREQLEKADALLVRSVTQVNERLLAGTAVTFVGTATSGFDHIDREWLAAQGIGFSHAPGSNANSVVEYVLAALGECADFLERVLSDERVGIVGYGHIGRALASRLEALKVNFCIYDPWLPPSEVPNGASLAELLESTVISLHTSLTTDAPFPSYHLLGEKELATLGAGQLLINAARGPVVDNAALMQRLETKDAPTVILDVWEHEPHVDAALLERVAFGSAHIAGYSFDGKLSATAMLVEKLLHSLGIEGVAAAKPVSAPVRLNAADSSAAALRQLIAQRYRLAEDDQRLREVVLDADIKDAAQAFDQLRKTYPVRRELAGSPVEISAESAQYESLVRALGAIPTACDGQ